MRLREGAAEIIREAEVRRETSDIDPWWGIWHVPTGERLSGPPESFYHPQLNRTMPIFPRRWRTRREAATALDELRRLACVEGAPQTEMFA